MKISLNWLSDFVDLDGISPDRVAELLSFHTAEVEGVESFGSQLVDVKIGHVVECGRHPDADKLSLTRVDFGGGEAVQVVCGASNVAQGQKIAFAPVGSTLPGGLKLKKAKLRGQLSLGMICSERELEFSDEHSGILVLPEEAPVGELLIDYLDLRDHVLEIENKTLTHRPDLWGHYGFARELAAILGRELRPLPVVESWPAAVCEVPVTLKDPDSCPLYLGLPVDLGGPPRTAPFALRRRLLAVGQRPINDVVDLTNYVLQEIGQPTHAFDLDLLQGPAIEVRRAVGKEALTTLDGMERALDDEDLVIADAGRAVALAGVMGGSETEVGSGTSRILLESAWFAPARIRRTSQRLGLRSEASSRFEKTLDPALAEQGLKRFARLLQEHRPEARVTGAPARAGEARAPETRLQLDPVRTRELLGLEIDAAAMRGHLESLGFGVEESGGQFQVQVPSWRAGKDVTVPVDLIEEVGRLAGYDQVQPRPLHSPVQPLWVDPVRMLGRRLADRAAHAHGAFETQGHTFLDKAWAGRLGLPEEAFASLDNPVQSGIELVRRDPIPTLLEQAAVNCAEWERGALFEIAKGYEPREGDLPRERKWLGAVRWSPPSKTIDGPDSCFGASRSLVEDLLRTAGAGAAAKATPGVERAAAPWCHPARGLSWHRGDQLLAMGGQVDPRLLAVLDIHRRDVTAILLDLDALTDLEGEDIVFHSPARFPGIKVDVALALPESVPFLEVEAALRKAGGKSLESLILFDVFRGGTVGAERRSLAFHAVLRAADRTLSDKDERKFLDRVEAAAKNLGGELRAG